MDRSFEMFQANGVLKHCARRNLITIIYHQLPALHKHQYHYYTQMVRIAFLLEISSNYSLFNTTVSFG